METRYGLAIAVMLGWLLLPAPSSAEHVRVQLKGGGEAAGELKEYVLGDHLTIDVGDGKLLRIAAASALSVEIGPAATAALPPTARLTAQVPLPQSQTVQSVVLQDLLQKRRYWETRYTGIAVPVTLVPLGALLLCIGGKIIARWDGHDASTGKIGYGLIIGGALTMAGGLAVLPFRTSKRRQSRELDRINERLRALGVQASIAPWLVPRAATTGGASAGLTATFRF